MFVVVVVVVVVVVFAVVVWVFLENNEWMNAESELRERAVNESKE
jgi:hypothetical protein